MQWNKVQKLLMSIFRPFCPFFNLPPHCCRAGYICSSVFYNCSDEISLQLNHANKSCHRGQRTYDWGRSDVSIMVTFHSIVPISISNAMGNRELHCLGEQGYFRGFSLQSTLHILLSTSIADCSTALLKNALLAPLKHTPLVPMKKKIRLLC